VDHQITSHQIRIFYGNDCAEILKGALEFANGNLTYTIPVDSEDEMGYLSHSLNYMADKLNKNGEYQRQFISNVSHDFDFG